MAISEQQCSENFHNDGDVTENGESDVESFDSDDPTFDIIEETRSGFSKLSIKKKSNSRMARDQDMGSEVDQDEVEMVVPELDERDKKSFENIQRMIQAGQLGKLKVEQCKVYLRKYGLRLTGTRDTLIQRIKEHLDVLDGGGEKKYPVSSFVLNCKGDACTGDIVMFEQNVYDMFNIASRSASGPPCGTRIVAGRIVKESYGAAKQQHTFTIEVLWSKGERPHPPLYPLLIKGRNLYRLKTLRQRWEDEGERQKALMEKHSRGSLARTDRESRMQEKEMRKKFRRDRVLRKEEPNKNQSLLRKEEPNNYQSHQFRKEEPNKNQTQVKPTNAAIYSGKPAMQTQQMMQPLQSHQKQISRPQSHPVMTGSWNSSMRKENTGQLPQTSTMPFNRQPLTSINHYPPLTSINHHPPLTSMNHYPPLSPTRPRQSRIPVTNQWQKQGQMQRQPCRYYAQGRCYFGDNCKFSHELRQERGQRGEMRY